MDRVYGRQDRVEADLCCLMCGRTIGQLSGLVWRSSPERPAAPSVVHMTEFRAAIAQAPSVPLTGGAQLRCGDCGGVGVLDEISVSPVRTPLLADDACPIHRERVRGPGRRPRGCACGQLQAAA